MSASASIEKASRKDLVTGMKRLSAWRDNAKKHAERVAEQTIHAAATIAGGAAAGALSVKYPEVGDTGIPTDALLAGVCLGAVLLDLTGKHSTAVNAFGSGLGAVAAAREVSKLMTK